MKIAPRASISQEFVGVLREIYKARLKLYKENLAQFNVQQKNLYLTRNRMNIVKLITLLTDNKSLDFELTRLRSLEYSAFAVKVNSSGRRYLCGLSFPVIIPLGGMKSNLGPYWVCASVDFLKGVEETEQPEREGRFHFYPQRNEMATHRTPHHYAYSLPHVPVRTPLDYGSSTCLGGFNTIIYSLAKAGDVTEFMRNALIYLNRHNPYDQLVAFSRFTCSWAEDA